LSRDKETFVDFSHSLSSISLLKVTQVFHQMDSSDILEIRGLDADTRQDLLKVLPQRAYEIISAETAFESDGLERMYIRKVG